MEGDVFRECTQRLMQAAEQIQIGQNSLIARNNTGARRESKPTQTASGPESLNSTTSPRSALSAAERSARDLERPDRIRLVQPGRSTGEFLVIGRRLGHRGAGRVVETAEGEEEGSQQHSRHISIARTRGQERSSVWLSASKMRFLPQAKESRLHKTA